jgi:hypothetical protein
MHTKKKVQSSVGYILAVCATRRPDWSQRSMSSRSGPSAPRYVCATLRSAASSGDGTCRPTISTNPLRNHTHYRSPSHIASSMAIAEVKQQSFIGWATKNLLSQVPLSRWSRLHLQSLAPTDPTWACVTGYGPLSLSVIHKEGLCPSSRTLIG